eukprot:Rmarinus@m.28057
MSDDGTSSWISYNSEEDENMGIEAITEPKKDCECWNYDMVFSFINTIAKKIADCCQISEEEALLLLQYYRWDEDRVTGEFFENRQQALIHSGVKSANPVKIPSEPEICSICYTSDADVAPLSCHHAFCKDCWFMYMKTKILDEKLSRINCPGEKCKVLLRRGVIEKYGNEEMVKIYDTRCLDSLVCYRKDLRFCPSPECDTVLKHNRLEEAHVREGETETVALEKQTVLCSNCQYSCCFRCGVAHEPATCKMMRQFEEQVDADGGNITWLKNNTRCCPRCDVSIEKNGGCNWIQCRSCRFEFCWLCLQYMKHSDFSVHKCNTYIDKGLNSDSNSERVHDLVRFEFFYSRHTAHTDSLRLEKELGPLVAQATEDMAAWVDPLDLQYLLQSWKILLEARTWIKASYVLAYYQKWPNANSKSLFEDLQHLLESRTEELSKLLSGVLEYLKPTEEAANPGAVPEAMTTEKTQSIQQDIRPKILSAMMIAKKNQENLYDCCRNLPSEVVITEGEEKPTRRHFSGLTCPYCLGKEVYGKKELWEHLNSAHDYEMSTKDSSMLLKCPYCDVETTMFGKHMKQYHKESLESGEVDESSDTDVPVRRSGKKRLIQTFFGRRAATTGK